MLKRSFITAIAAVLALGCTPKEDYGWIKTGIETAQHQLMLTAAEIDGENLLPRTVWSGYDADKLEYQLEVEKETFLERLKDIPDADKMGKRKLCGVLDWTSGFYPGSLWYVYEFTGDEAVKEQAVKYTELLNPVREYTGTHDLGFMINCSYGNALRLAPNDTIPAVMIQTADNLCSRFNEEIGCIRSWDFGTWNYPVIIDNMMNLDLLFNVARLTGNPYYREIALKHADTTMPNHFREDMTSWHVVSYNNDGTVERKETYQGKNHDSAWARGQAWALYGYPMIYRFTKEQDILDHAVAIAEYLLPRLPEDAVPYWDYDSPEIPNDVRDASSAAIMASGLIELSKYVDAEKSARYLAAAEKMLRALASDEYLVPEGEEYGFILRHSTGNKNKDSEVDVPLTYADYYFLEALMRWRNL